VLLGVTWVLVAEQLPGNPQSAGKNGDMLVVGTGPSGASPGTLPQDQVRQLGANFRSHALSSILTQGGIALLIVGAAAVALGWLIAGRMLQQLHRVTDAARRIAGAPDADRGLHERIALDGPADEIKELADTFDLMLERLDASFEGQRRFIANASHELRTPVALNRTLLEVALYRTPGPTDVRLLGATLLEINGRQERLLDGLLLLARSDREVSERSYVDLADIVEHVADEAAPGAVELIRELGEAPTMGNPVLLERLVQNLVDNGLLYNTPDGWVRVSTATAADGTARLVVSNTGPVVPAYDIPQLFEPFRRLRERGAEHPPGSGLGLSIVRAVATAHGGQVRARPRAGGGLVVTVTLPSAPPASAAEAPDAEQMEASAKI
jgi:signal transduction histidine kinase